MSTAGAPAEWASRVELAACLRGLALHDLHEGIDHHVSLALPGTDDRFLLNPFGPHWTEVRASDLLVVGLDDHGRGALVEGDGEAETTAFHLHSRLHRARPEARCVLHAHPPHATAVSVLADGFDTQLTQNAMKFHGKVGWVDDDGGRIVDEAEGDRIAGMVAGGVRVVFLAHHGVLVVGEDVARAFWDLYFLERACQVQLLATAAGAVNRVSAETAALTSAQFEAEREDGAPALFAALRRRLDRELPGYDT